MIHILLKETYQDLTCLKKHGNSAIFLIRCNFEDYLINIIHLTDFKIDNITLFTNITPTSSDKIVY